MSCTGTCNCIYIYLPWCHHLLLCTRRCHLDWRGVHLSQKCILRCLHESLVPLHCHCKPLRINKNSMYIINYGHCLILFSWFIENMFQSNIENRTFNTNILSIPKFGIQFYGISNEEQLNIRLPEKKMKLCPFLMKHLLNFDFQEKGRNPSQIRWE